MLDVRTLLRLRLRSAPLRAMAAATALGELGDERDALRLLRTAMTSSWPMPPAALHAVLQIARRGKLGNINIKASLCESASSRDPFVRANVAVAMAYLRATACQDGPSPLEWLTPAHTWVVRAAAARWAYAAALSGAVPRESVRDALRECYTRDPEPLVAQACLAPQLPAPSPSGLTDRDASRATPFSHRLVAVHQSDGGVFIGYSDLNGELPDCHLAPGEIALSDPHALPLEP